MEHRTEHPINLALNLIRDVPQNVSESDRDFFLSYATGIYHSAGITDTAYFYAKNLINSTVNDYRSVGYSALLEPNISVRLSYDSISAYAVKYRDAINQTYNKAIVEAATRQISEHKYNVKLQNLMSTKKDFEAKMVCIVFLSLLIIVDLVTLHRGSPSKKKEEIRSVIQTTDFYNKNIIEEITELSQRKNEAKSLPNDAAETEGYKSLKEALHKGHILIDEDPIWEILTRSLHQIAPDFEAKLMYFSGNKITVSDFRFAILVRFGFSSSQIADLIGRESNTITYRRGLICSRVFHNQIKTRDLPLVIRLL